MKKKFLLAPLVLAVLACNAILGAPAAAPSAMPPTVQPPTALASEATDPPPTPTRAHGYVEVRLHSRDGALPDQLTAESKKAAAMGLMPVAEFDASW